MRTRSAALSPFGELLTACCQRAGKTLYEVGLRVGIKDRGLLSRATRPQRTGKRHRLLNVAQIRQLADVLNCTKAEAARLIVLGCLEYAPEPLAVYMERIELDLERAYAALGKPVPKYHLSY